MKFSGKNVTIPFRTCWLILGLALWVATCPATAVTNPPVRLDVDWPSFLARQDPLWEKMPADYYEGPFVGNGLMGTLLFKDDKEPNSLRFEIGRTDVYDHRVNDRFGVARLPIGQLLLTPVGNIQKVHFRTDLWNAEIRGEMTTSEGTIALRCYVPSGSELIVVDLKSTGGEAKAKVAFRPEQGNHPRRTVAPGRDKNVDYVPNPPFQVETREGVEVVTQPLLVGDDYATAWSDDSRQDGSRTVLITVANRWAKTLTPAKGSAEDAVATIQAARKQDLSVLETSHREWWHQFYPASFISVPEGRLENFYWIQMYKLASATRENRPVVDLMGPWFRKSVWAAYWTNLNIQLAYYTEGITNHLDLGEPLYQLMERRTNQLIENVPPDYQNDCAGLGNPVGYDVLNARMGLTRDPNTRLGLIALPWLMQLFYTHNRMTMDDTRLRNTIYPLMKRTFQSYVRVMTVGEDGLYHIPYTFSDEYGPAHETSLNIALAQWGFQTLIECAQRLKIDDPMLPQWREILKKMADYPTDENGIMIGRDVPFAKSHRHYSHLFAIFPLYIMNIEHQPEHLAMMQKSIQHFTDLEGDNCMFKYSGASSLWAALGDGDQALHWLERSLELLPRKVPTIGPNTLYSENGWPTFESPISSSRSMLDMLIQSWGGTIRIFPACPASWPEASFYQLRAEGGFLVSAVRHEGKTQWVSVKSLAGEPCRIKYDGVTQDLKLAKGEEIVLGGSEPVVKPVPTVSGPDNAWGLREP
jgi:hypothetical protein